MRGLLNTKAMGVSLLMTVTDPAPLTTLLPEYSAYADVF